MNWVQLAGRFHEMGNSSNSARHTDTRTMLPAAVVLSACNILAFRNDVCHQTGKCFLHQHSSDVHTLCNSSIQLGELWQPASTPCGVNQTSSLSPPPEGTSTYTPFSPWPSDCGTVCPRRRPMLTHSQHSAPWMAGFGPLGGTIRLVREAGGRSAAVTQSEFNSNPKTGFDPLAGQGEFVFFLCPSELNLVQTCFFLPDPSSCVRHAPKFLRTLNILYPFVVKE